jgi:O-antigen/teichoic acid export membrane protein
MNRQDVKPLITFGGWVTVSNLIVPFMLYCDRFFVGAFLTISAVTYYATTYDVITKLTIIPSAIARAFFPAFAEALVANRARALQLLHRGTDLTFLAIAPIIVVAVTFAPEALHLWLGPAFAVKSGPVLRWLAIGVLVNSVGHLPYTLLQAANRPDITAKLHIVELPFYVGLVSCLIRWYGIEGAAIAWTARLVFDTAGYWVAAILLLPEAAETARRAGAAMVAVLVVITMSVYLPAGLVAKTVFVSLALSLGGFCGWLYLLTAEEKEHVSRSITIVGAMVGRSI